MKRPGEREPSFAVLDIETVVSDDIDNYRKVFEEPKLTEWQNKCRLHEELKKAGKLAKNARKPSKPKLKSDEACLHWATGQICCVGLLYLEGEEYSRVSGDEEDLLEWAYNILEADKPTHIITFNGNEFDMPFFLMSSLAWGIPVDNVIPKITGRYPSGYIDIYDQLSKWKITATLAQYAYKLNCHDTLYGDGSQVQGWFDQGEDAEIGKHNLGDIRTTARLFGKVKGALTWK